MAFARELASRIILGSRSTQTSPQSHALQNAAGNDRLVVVIATGGAAANAGTLQSAVTYDGAAPTGSVVQATSANRNISAVYWWSDTDLPATAGSYDVAINWSSLAVTLLYVEEMTGVSQVAPIAEQVSAATSSSGSDWSLAHTETGLPLYFMTSSVSNHGAGPDTITGETAQHYFDRAGDFSTRIGLWESTTGPITISKTGSYLAYALAGIAIEPAPTGPAITSVDSDDIITDAQTGVTVAGSNFSASGNTVTLEYATASQSSTQIIDTESTTSIDIDVVLGDVPHTQNSSGTNLSGIGVLLLQVEDDSAQTGTIEVELRPGTGEEVIAIGASPDTSSASVLSLVPGSVTIAENDQIRYDTTTANGFTVTMNDDGTFSISGGTGSDSFDVDIWTAADGRSNTFTVPLVDGTIASGNTGVVRAVAVSVASSVTRSVA